MKKLSFLFLLICFPAMAMVAQVNAPPVNTKVDLPKDEEDLNVFQQWLRWNNNN